MNIEKTDDKPDLIIDNESMRDTFHRNIAWVKGVLNFGTKEIESKSGFYECRYTGVNISEATRLATNAPFHINLIPIWCKVNVTIGYFWGILDVADLPVYGRSIMLMGLAVDLTVTKV
jgi:hypothetical protein